MLVIPDSKYSWRVPVQIGTGIIDRVMSVATPEELKQDPGTWRHTHTGMVITGKMSQFEVAITEPVRVLPFGSNEVKGKTKSGDIQNVLT